MKLSELTAPYEKHRVIQYGADGNKVVRHYLDLRPVGESVYMTKPELDQWKTPRFDVCICFKDIPDGIMFASGYRLSDDLTDEKLIQEVRKYSLDTPTHFLDMLDAAVAENRFIGNAQIEFVAQYDPGKAALYARHRAAYYEQKHKEEAEKKERRQREDAAYCKEQNEKAEAAVNEAVAVIRNGGVLKNNSVEFFRSKYDSSAYSIVNYLMRRYGVNVPLRTQGWINSRLLSATVENGRCSSLYYNTSKGGKSSRVFFQYMNELISKVGSADTQEMQKAS